MTKAEVGSVATFDRANIRYLTGFTGEDAAAVITLSEAFVISDARFRFQASAQAPAASFVEVASHLEDTVASLLVAKGKTGGGTATGIDPGALSVRAWQRLEPQLGDLSTRFVSDLVETCREVKDPGELQAMRAAATLVTKMFGYLESLKVVGMSEAELALELEIWARRHGSEGIPFPYIVASGHLAALPHAEPSVAKIERDRLLIVDIGTVVGGYASDMTRTYATGRVDDELSAAHAAVETAQAAARRAARPGMSCAELDSVARLVLQERGLGDMFLHSLGHGVGLEVHENPGIGQRSNSTLAEQMVVTIEPGVYLEGRGGVRIEDTVLITDDGAEVLTEWPRSLTVLG